MSCFTTTSCSVFVKRKAVIGCKNKLRFAIYLSRSRDLRCDFFWYLYGGGLPVHRQTGKPAPVKSFPFCAKMSIWITLGIEYYTFGRTWKEF